MDEELIAGCVRRVLHEMDHAAAAKEDAAPVHMTLRLAQELSRRVEEEAARQGIRIVCAVADAGGHLRLMHGMDDAYIGSVDVAVNKAYTCAAFRMSTQQLSVLAAPGGPLYGIQHTNGGRIVIFGGGEPLVLDGRLVGALGVSGGSAEQDTALAAYGASVLKEVVSCL